MSDAPKRINVAWNDEDDDGRLEYTTAGRFLNTGVDYIRADLVAELVDAARIEDACYMAYIATPTDRGGNAGPKGTARKNWQSARDTLRAALAALQEPGR